MLQQAGVGKSRLGCRLYQSHLKDSQDKMRSKAAAAKQAASQPNKAGNQREAGLRAAMTSPLSPHFPHPSKPPGLLAHQALTLCLSS